MNILKEVESFVTQLYEDNSSEPLMFHDIKHTQEVVEAAKLIGNKTGLKDDEMELLLISAWLHDIGYTQSYSDHEEEGIKIAKEFLFSKKIDPEMIENIVGGIEATRIPQNPKNRAEEVLCDADMYHLSEKSFFDKTLTIRKEMNASLDKDLNKVEYYELTIDFFNSHKYYTDYGKEVLEIGKKKNLKKLNKKLDKKLNKATNKKKGKKMDKKKGKFDKIKSPARGVESMFRLTARNQISLSSIADNKANILITVNSIILSIVITVLFGKFSEYPMLIIPTIIFLISCLTTIVFAILTTRPKVSSGTFTKEDIKAKKVNLLFFGNFYNMSLDDYDWAVKDMMKDYDGLYGNMIMDQYYLGRVLAKKYKRLWMAYNIFMYGIIISVVIFLVTMIFFTG